MTGQHPRDNGGSSRLRQFVLSLACFTVLSACSRPDIVEPAGGNFVAPSEDGIGLELVGGTFRVDGETRSDRINLSTSRFVYLFVFIKAKGLYIVSAKEVPNAKISGRFSGGRLVFQTAGTRIELEGEGDHLLGDNKDRSAWVEYLPDYELLGPDAQPGHAVVGLAARKILIPGYLSQAQ